MYDGLWTVEFIAMTGLSGTGVIVLNNGRLLGGDAGYYYSGKYKIRGDVFEGEISVVRFDKNSISVFGELDRFGLNFKGKMQNGNRLEAVATFAENPNMQMVIKGTKREDI